jgi:hypothetical protein
MISTPHVTDLQDHPLPLPGPTGPDSAQDDLTLVTSKNSYTHQCSGSQLMMYCTLSE